MDNVQVLTTRHDLTGNQLGMGNGLTDGCSTISDNGERLGDPLMGILSIKLTMSSSTTNGQPWGGYKQQQLPGDIKCPMSTARYGSA